MSRFGVQSPRGRSPCLPSLSLPDVWAVTQQGRHGDLPLQAHLYFRVLGSGLTMPNYNTRLLLKYHTRLPIKYHPYFT